MTHTEAADNEGLLVRRIRNGTVIDHIDGGEALNVVKILGITGTTQEALSIATNVPSRDMEKKDKKLIALPSSRRMRRSISSVTSRSARKRESRSHP